MSHGIREVATKDEVGFTKIRAPIWVSAIGAHQNVGEAISIEVTSSTAAPCVNFC